MIIWDTPILAEVEQVVDDLKTELNLQGIDLLKDKKRSHGNILCTCINHADGQEKKPSMGISTDDVSLPDRFVPAGTAHCFTCGYTASLPEFISNCFGKNDKGMFGFKWLTRNYVNVAIENRKPLEVKITRGTKKEEEPVTYISEEELAKYRFYHPYMWERKLTEKVVNYFDVGYDQEQRALTFPVMDKQGNVLFIQRRSVQGKRFLNAAEIGKGETIYGLYHIYINLSWVKEVWITESIIDALTLWTRRIPAVATMGAKITMKQMKLLNELPVRRFVEALDQDEAGRDGAEFLHKHLKGKMLYTALLNVHDVNEHDFDDAPEIPTTIYVPNTK